MTRHIITAFLCLLALTIPLATTTVARQFATRTEPAACHLNGGQWRAWGGWECYPPLPGPPAARVRAVTDA